MQFKIMCVQPKKGIQRSLPYRMDNADAVLLCNELNDFFTKNGHYTEYVHHVEEAEPEPVKEARVVRGRKSVR